MQKWNTSDMGMTFFVTKTKSTHWSNFVRIHVIDTALKKAYRLTSTVQVSIKCSLSL